MKPNIRRILSQVFFLLLPPTVASGEEGWRLTLQVNAEGARDYCIVGSAPEASDGLDLAWDVPAFPSSLNNTYIHATFPHPEWNHTFTDFREDIHGLDAGYHEWKLEIVSNISGDFTLTWPKAKRLEGFVLTLRDEGAGTNVDLATIERYIYSHVAGQKRTFLLAVEVPGVLPPPDTDGDGVADADDLFPADPTDWADFDGDGIGDTTDYDDDNDGVPDLVDAYPLDATRWAVATSGNGGGTDGAGADSDEAAPPSSGGTVSDSGDNNGALVSNDTDKDTDTGEPDTGSNWVGPGMGTASDSGQKKNETSTAGSDTTNNTKHQVEDKGRRKDASSSGNRSLITVEGLKTSIKTILFGDAEPAEKQAFFVPQSGVRSRNNARTTPVASVGPRPSAAGEGVPLGQDLHPNIHRDSTDYHAKGDRPEAIAPRKASTLEASGWKARTDAVQSGKSELASTGAGRSPKTNTGTAGISGGNTAKNPGKAAGERIRQTDGTNTATDTTGTSTDTTGTSTDTTGTSTDKAHSATGSAAHRREGGVLPAGTGLTKSTTPQKRDNKDNEGQTAGTDRQTLEKPNHWKQEKRPAGKHALLTVEGLKKALRTLFFGKS